MKHGHLKAGRLQSGLTQVQAARRLGVSQPYLSQLERGDRPVTVELARRAASLYGLPATALPVPEVALDQGPADPDRLARQLAGLGYPGFAHLRGRKTNPAVVLLAALRHPDLDVRLTEALPWLVLAYPDLDWPWLVSQAKLHEVQNRLGFVVAMARASTHESRRSAVESLTLIEQQLERARLAREDTLCRESMSLPEREWLGSTRSAVARHWNLLTGLTADHLSYA